MTLAIKTSDVSAVLLADGWHEVEPRSFTMQRLAFTDADGFELRKAAQKMGYRFVEQQRSLGSVQTVVVAGPLKAILAVRTAANVPASVQQTPAQASATIPAPPEPSEARSIEVLPPPPEEPKPLRSAPAAPSAPYLESVPMPSPPFEREARADASADQPVSGPNPTESFESALTEASPRFPPRLPESPGRFDREPQIGFEPRAEDQVEPAPAPVPGLSPRRDGEEPSRGAAPERETPSQMAKPATQTTSILLLDEMERDRLARAGHPVSEGLGLNGLGLRRSVAEQDDEAVGG